MTTAGLWAAENKWIGGKDLGINFVLNTAPFGVGKIFSSLRNSASIALKTSKLLMAGSYLAEGVVDA